MSMAAKLGKNFIYNEERLSIKSQGPIMTWSYKVTKKIRSVIYLLPQNLWPTKIFKVAT